MICPNCGRPVAEDIDTGCVLAAFIGAIRDRGSLDEQELLKLHSSVDADRLWSDAARIIDDLEDGLYSGQAEEED